MNLTENPVYYGDYIYLKLFQGTSRQGYVVTANGYYSNCLWAGGQENLNIKNYRDCLFQILPNVHSASYGFVKSSITQYNLLKTLSQESENGHEFLGSLLDNEMKKQSSREDRIDLLNKKEIEESLGKPLLYGGKFMLRHVESGMYLESTSRMSSISHCLELKLSEKPSPELYFEIMACRSSKKKGDIVEYSDQIKIYSTRLSNFICAGDVSLDSCKSLDLTKNPFLSDKDFPHYPPRRPESRVDNGCTKLAGASLSQNDPILLVNYEHVSSEYLKTGEYIRITNHELGYFTIYNGMVDAKLFFQKYELLDYQYNQINTIFQIVAATNDFTELPVEEPIETMNPSNQNYDSKEAKCYLLKHFITGKYIAEKDGSIILVESSDIFSILEGNAIAVKVQFVAKPHHQNQLMHRSVEFEIRFIRDGHPPVYFDKGNRISIPTKNYQMNSKYYFGFDNPDEYLVKKLRPMWFGVAAADTIGSTLKYLPVDQAEMIYILQAESLATAFENFFDFCSDLRTPLERVQIEQSLKGQPLEKQQGEGGEAKTKGAQEGLKDKLTRAERKRQHEIWMEEEIEARKRTMIIMKKKELKLLEDPTKNQNQVEDVNSDPEGVLITSTELEMIEDEAYYAVLQKELLLGIEPQDYEDPDDRQFDDSVGDISVGIAEDVSEAQFVNKVKPSEKDFHDNNMMPGMDTKRRNESLFRPEAHRGTTSSINQKIDVMTRRNESRIGKDEEGSVSSARRKRRRQLTRIANVSKNKFSIKKIEKECLRSLSGRMKALIKTIQSFLGTKEESQDRNKGEDISKQEIPNQVSVEQTIRVDDHVVLDPVKQWAVREFRIIDYINVALHNFLRADTITTMIKELRTKYTKDGVLDESFYDFDVEMFNNFARVLVELLFAVTKKDYLNHLYNSQFVRVYINGLLVTTAGIYKIVPLWKLSRTRKLILECCKVFLWDEDTDAISQLNFYQKQLFNAIRTTEDYEGLYINLLDNQCRSKAPNLDNKIATGFILDFLTNEEDLNHTFPKITEDKTGFMVHFERKAGRTNHTALKELEMAAQHGDDPEFSDLLAMAEYLLQAFRLVNSLSNLNNLVFFQTIIKHYPYEILDKVSKKTSATFFEFSVLAAEMIINVHMKYVKIPIDKFPEQIQIVGTEAEIARYKGEINKILEKNIESLLSDLEIETLNEKRLKDDVLKCKEIFKSKRATRQAELELRQQDIANSDTGNIYVTLTKLKSFLSVSIDEISLDYLRSIHELFYKVLEKMTIDNIPEKKAIVEKKTHSMNNGNSSTESKTKAKKVYERTKTSVGSPEKAEKKQNYGPDVALEILAIFRMIETKLINVAALKILQVIKERALRQPEGKGRSLDKKMAGHALLGLIHDNRIKTSEGEEIAHLEFDQEVLSNVIMNYKDDWKNRAALYHISKDHHKRDQVLQGEHDAYSGDNLTKLFFDMILLRKSSITREVITVLKDIAKFENTLYVELKKMTMINDDLDLKRVAEIVNIICKLNSYSRLFQCEEHFKKEIPKEKLTEIFKDIDKMVNFLLFSVYRAKKHFRYSDQYSDPEDRFLKGFEALKTPRWDKPFKLNPEAINKIYQKIFLMLKVPEALFELIRMTIEIRGNSVEPDIYQFIIRKAIVTLCAFVYQNEENQNAIYDKKYLILNYYHQPFIDQSCDVYTLFTELMRDNDRLQKLPLKYLYDITWCSLLEITKRKVSPYENNSYLCTALMALHFISNMKIGGFEAETCIKEKFAEITETLKSDNSLNIFYLYKDKTRAIELPYHYYSIREFFSSWLEIYKTFLKSVVRLERIFGQFQLTHWNEVLANPSIAFQFEIRNLLCKTLARSWYGTRHRIIVFDQFEGFKTFVFRLFADLSAYIWMMAQESPNLIELVNYDFKIDPKSSFGEDSYVRLMKNVLQDFRREKGHEAHFQIYIEEISLMNLWKEHIYDGCLGLLSTLVLQEAESMMYNFNQADEKFPNLISYYLYLIQKLMLIPTDTSTAQKKIEDDFQRMTVLPEYKPIKEKIERVAQDIRNTRPLIKSHSNIGKFNTTTVEHDLYEAELNRLLVERKSTKERNTTALANLLGSMPYAHAILSEIILYVKKEYRKIKSSELTFVLKLLRKFIERENSLETDLPIYMWETVKITDIRKMQRLQNFYKTLGFTEFLIDVVNQVKGTNVLKEFLLVGMVYLYGGNSEIQQEYYNIFIKDYNNPVINRLRLMLTKYAEEFRTYEQYRIDNLYKETVGHIFERGAEFTNENGDEFFGKIRNMLPEELLKDCMETKSSNMIVLILSFLQALAEKQCKELQNFMREQVYTDEKGETRRLANSFNFLSEFRSFFNSFFRLHSRFSSTIGIKLIDVLTEYIQGDVAMNVHDLLNKTLLFDMSRVLTDFNSPYHLLPRGYEFDPNEGDFRTLKSKVIGFIKALVEFPDPTVLDRIQRYLDAEGLLDAFESNMYKFFGFDQKKPVKGIYTLMMSKVEELELKDFEDGVLMDALNIYMIFRYLWEDNDTFKEKIEKLVENAKRTDKEKEILDSLLNTFCTQVVHCIEIVMQEKKRDLIKYWFPILPVCRYLPDSTRENFEKNVDRSNIQAKIAGLMESSDEFIPQMYNDYNASQRYFGLNMAVIYSWLRRIGNGLAIAINVTNLATLEYDLEEDNVSYIPSYNSVIATVFCVINLVVAGLVAIYWYITTSKRHITVCWEHYSDRVYKEKGPIPPRILLKLEEKRYNDITKEECLQILNSSGINSEHYEEIKQSPLLRGYIRWTMLRMKIIFLCQALTFMWHFVYLGLSIGSIFTPICASLLLSDIAIQSDAIMQVFKAISTNWKQFLWTLFLLMNIALFYTFVSFYTLQPVFQSPEGEPYCQYAFGCFLNILDLGLRMGGGIGDAILYPAYTGDNSGYFFGKVVFDLTFFVIMIVILLNLIFGMIIDAFGDLRDKRKENEEDQKNICFVCGIDRAEFERHISFDHHVLKEHFHWDYVFAIVYIKDKFKNRRTEMTELENYVNDKYRAKNYQWCPIGRSLTLEKIQETVGSQKDENAILLETVKSLANDVREMKKKAMDSDADS